MAIPDNSSYLSYYLRKITRIITFDLESVSIAEKLVASIGGMIGITLISAISFQFSGAAGAALIVPSMGAAAVLVFAVPHGKLSQPWPLIGGNLISAAIGVSCYKLVADPFIAAGLAVGLSIGCMHMLSCMHPPGGATALAAVVGGPAIHKLGFAYLITPVLLNLIVIFSIAVIFNSFFPWRRYPAATMMRFTEQNQQENSNIIDKQTIEKALAEIDQVIDVTVEDLQRVLQLSLNHAKNRRLTAHQIKLNHFYTNGHHGPEWSVRRIIDESYSPDPQNDMVIYRVVEGQRFNTADSCSREEFARWATNEVFPNAK